MEKPITKLEKEACSRAKEREIEEAIETKMVIYKANMGNLIALKNMIVVHEEQTKLDIEKYTELAYKLGVTKDDEKLLF